MLMMTNILRFDSFRNVDVMRVLCCYATGLSALAVSVRCDCLQAGGVSRIHRRTGRGRQARSGGDAEQASRAPLSGHIPLEAKGLLALDVM